MAIRTVDTVATMSEDYPREGWEESFIEMAARGDDRLLDPETPTEWDKSEWEW